MDDIYKEVGFYEQWWLLINLAELIILSIGGYWASYQRPSLWRLRVIGVCLISVGSAAILYSLFFAWTQLSLEIVEVYSTEYLRVVKDPPPPQRWTNWSNLGACIVATLLPFIGWKVLKFSLLLRHGPHNPYQSRRPHQL